MALCVVHDGQNGVCCILLDEAGVMLSGKVGCAHVEVGVLAACSPKNLASVLVDFVECVCVPA